MVDGSASATSLDASLGVTPLHLGSAGDARTTSDAAADETAVAANIAAAITRVPHGTSLLVTASLLAWRRNPDAMRIVDVAMAQPTVVEMLAVMPACVRDLVGHAEWVVVSAKSRGMADGYVVQLGGIASAHAAQLVCHLTKPVASSTDVRAPPGLDYLKVRCCGEIKRWCSQVIAR